MRKFYPAAAVLFACVFMIGCSSGNAQNSAGQSASRDNVSVYSSDMNKESADTGVTSVSADTADTSASLPSDTAAEPAEFVQADSSGTGSTQNSVVKIEDSLQDKGQWYKTGDCSYSLDINSVGDHTIYIKIDSLGTVQTSDTSLLDGNVHRLSLDPYDNTVREHFTVQYHDGMLDVSGINEDEYNGTYYKNDFAAFGFLQPYSREILLYEDDYCGYAPDELKTARNEILARHGHIFSDDPDAQAFFDNKAWYAQNSKESSLDAIEESNIEVLDTLISNGSTGNSLEESPSKDELVDLNYGLQTVSDSPFSISIIDGTFTEYQDYNTVDALLSSGGFTATKQEVEEGLSKGQITLVTDEITGSAKTYIIFEDKNKNVCVKLYDTDSPVKGRLTPDGDYMFVFYEGSDDRVEKPLKQATIYLSKNCRTGYGYGFFHPSNYDSPDGTVQTSVIDA